jgi:hypothetical protein
LKIAQKEETKKIRKRNKFMELKDPKQPRLDKFGIQPFAQPTRRDNKASRKVAQMAYKRRSPAATVSFGGPKIILKKIN